MTTPTDEAVRHFSNIGLAEGPAARSAPTFCRHGRHEMVIHQVLPNGKTLTMGFFPLFCNGDYQRALGKFVERFSARSLAVSTNE